ncbi:MAG: phosphomannomutase/phosphoglucomutase [Chloroflexi bacterium]|nr:phosphomannomutase/phosphoglucomutase [Chloroflexota bacterium]
MTLNPDIFREYSIRGVVPDELNAPIAHRLGQALGTYLRGREGRSAVVGHDVRLHSPELADAFIVGLRGSGVDVIFLGLTPTPLINFATDLLGADAGVAVTASHNPPGDNGLKIRTDHTLQGAELRALRELAQQGRFAQGRGRLRGERVHETYLGLVGARVPHSLGLRVVVDGGNGANGPLVATLLARLGCRVTLLHGEPDGRFPHRSPNPLAPGALEGLQRAVRAEAADLGLAYDGDGDRLVVVDEAGQIAWGDRLLALLARPLLATQPGARVVYEVSCSQALVDDVLAHGGVPVASPVGYARVHERMRGEGAVLAGEMAGHFFFADPQFRFDDAILATAKVAELAAAARRPFSALLAELPTYHTSPERRVACPDERKEEVAAALARSYEGQRPLETLDGVRVQFPEGWGLVRASQTQPALSMRFEGRSPEALAAIEAELTGRLRGLLEGIGWREE